MYPVQVTGDRVRLREFREDDVDQALALVGDDRVTTFLSFDSRTHAETAAMVRGIVERAQADPRTEYYLAVTSLTSDDLIGFVRLAFAGVQAGKLGYAVAADHWGHGYATDAAATMLEFGFTTLGLHRISAAIGPDNAASIQVVKRLGFHHEGRLRDHVHTNGAWRDSELYSVLAHEWATARQPHRTASTTKAS
jgi:[ribosomal protein S5]-alanine N-acetyltransferase